MPFWGEKYEKKEEKKEKMLRKTEKRLKTNGKWEIKVKRVK
jgi:hypothetical protein